MTRQRDARGYYGVALWQPKIEENFGGVLRSAHAFGASFVCLIGARYRKQASDTSHAALSLPVYTFDALGELDEARPHGCQLVRVEIDGEHELPRFVHPRAAIYLLGGEDRTLPSDVGETSVRIALPFCLNLASTASIVMYDRYMKESSR